MQEAERPQNLGAVPSLQVVIERGRKIAEHPEVKPGNVKLWFASVRAPLRNAFGPDAPVLSLWPTFKTPVAKELARETLLLRIGQHEALVLAVIAAAETALESQYGKRVFIGHGRSPLWRELKDFLVDRLHLPVEEFNREAVAGTTTSQRLHEMLANASFAFLVMTAEDEHADATVHARENVVHEIGLFQGRLGMRKAIILLEEGCAEFSNIHGLSYIPFPRGHVSAVYEEIRRVLEREQIVGT